jgi:hypothetical protein
MAVVVIASMVLLAAPPSPADSPDPLYLAQNLLQVVPGPLAAATRFAPDLYANPEFMPDWNHDGIYGDAADVQSEQQGAPAEGPFLYPCIGYDSAVTYRTTSGSCEPIGTPGAVFRRGMAERFKVVDAFGLALTSTLWLPDVALRPGAHGFPGLVFINGHSVAQRSYYMYDMAAAAAGFVVLSFDPVGQGTSEGTETLQEFRAPQSGHCYTTTKCRELQQMVRWFTGSAIAAQSPSLGLHNPGTNLSNPALALLDLSRIAIAGQSNGGLAVSNYLELLPSGHDADGRPLPSIAAAVALSGFAPASSVVPVQAQTADLDIPGVTATNLGLNLTDGPLGTTAWYDQLEASHQGHGMLELIIMEGGSHGDTSDIPGAPHAVWAWALSTGYFTDFLTCTVTHDPTGCQGATTPRPHLSQAYASEYDGDGPAGAGPSRCLAVPTKPSLEQALDVANPAHLLLGLLGRPPYNCTP